MHRQCFVSGCVHSKGKKGSEKISFHKFRITTQSSWLKAINKEHVDNTTGTTLPYTICSIHFTDEDFEFTANSNYKILKKFSIPTLFLGNEIGQCKEVRLVAQAASSSWLSPKKVSFSILSLGTEEEIIKGKIHPSSTSSGSCTDLTNISPNTKQKVKVIRKIHSYSHSPNHMVKSYSREKKRNKLLCLNIYNLRRKNLRLNKRVKHLKNVMLLLKKSKI